MEIVVAFNLVKQLAEAPPAAGAPVVAIRKHSLATALVRNQLDGKIFRVVLAIDASGSTKELFAEQGDSSFWRRQAQTQPSIVQRSLERMVPIADLLDDDHSMEVWYFGSRPSRSDAVTIETMDGYIRRTWEQKTAAGWDNVEPLLMSEIINWAKDIPSPYPTLVLAWSDGGVGNERQIKELLVNSSNKPIFWMWLGLGQADYGVLKRLDDIQGGLVDNAGFIEIDNIEAISDDELYARIFALVTKWYREAAAAGVIVTSD